MRLSTIAVTSIVLFSSVNTCVHAQQSPDVQVNVIDNQHIVMNVQLGKLLLQGRADLNNGYARLPMDGMVLDWPEQNSAVNSCTADCTNENEGGTGTPANPNILPIPDWGTAEVLIDCDTGTVDIIVNSDSDEWSYVSHQLIDQVSCP